MKKKRSTTLRDSLNVFCTIAFLLFCIYGAYFSIRKFFDSLNASLTKMNEKPIATITFKYKTAQRKFQERMVWDRLAQQSPVYDGDTIRTAPESEATIFFEDGNIMDLDENTMAQIFFHEGKMQTSVEEGAVVVNSTGAENGAVVMFGDSRIELNSGASVGTNVSKENGAQINVMQGDAVFTSQDGSVKELQEGKSIALNKNNEEQIVPLITVTQPRPNERVLNFTGTARTIDYKWTVQNLSANDFLVLEIATDKKFKNIIQKEELNNLNTAKVGLQNGLYYWRIYPSKAGEQYSAQSKINILDVPTPSLIVPESNAEYSFKAIAPDVRFSWTQNDWVTAFDFEVADNSRMANPIIKQRITTASSIVSSLGAGTWYWRVTPYYSINGTGLAEPSEIRSFTIAKRNTLGIAELILPAAGETINTAQKQEIQFSWKNTPEVIEYEIKISDNENLSNPKIVQKTKTNFFALNAAQNSMKKGTWYWAVTQRDGDGEVSAQSEIRKFSTDEILFEQRLIYPPESFSVIDANVEDLRFSWRTNVKGDNLLQIASDKKFRDIVFSSVANSQFLQGVTLSGGTYYWRIISKDSEQHSSKVHTLNVLSTLANPVLVAPTNGQRFTLGRNTRTTFRWNSVSGADYYLLKLSNVEQPEEILYSKKISGTRDTISFENLDEGEYNWSVQAVANATSFAPQRESGFTTRSIILQKPKRATVTQPAKPTLPTVSLAAPEDKMVFGIEQVRASKSIKFSWASVKGATGYLFTLKSPDGKTLVEKTLTTTEYTQEGIVNMNNGRYTWTVQAIDNSRAQLPSHAAARTFTINLPVVEEIILNNTGVLYGM